MIVIDASALTDVLLEREEAVSLLKEEYVGHEHEPLNAPEVIEPETLNALQKMSLRGSVTLRRATLAVSDLANTRLVRYPHEPLRPRMWDLRDQLSAYDAAYLALAEAMETAVLLTADRGLAKVSQRVLGRERVRMV